MSNYIEVSDSSFEADVEQSSLPVLVDFWAAWCAPCRMVGPIVEQIADEYQGKLTVAKMDVDANQDTPSKFGITGIPTLILFKDGKVFEKLVGAVPKAKIKELVERAI